MIDWTQLWGWFAAIAGFSALAAREERSVRIGLIVHTVCYLVHFALLGLPAAVVANVVALMRLTLSLRYRSWWLVVVLTGAALMPCFFYGTGWVSLLPMAASVVLTVALFRFEGARLRVSILVASLLWLIHNLVVGSLGGVVVECGMSLSSLCGLLREKRLQH